MTFNEKKRDWSAAKPTDDERRQAEREIQDKARKRVQQPINHAEDCECPSCEIPI